MDYWTTKFDVNVARDSRAQSALEAAGSKVSIVWECETRDAQALAVTLAVRAQDPEGGLVPYTPRGNRKDQIGRSRQRGDADDLRGDRGIAVEERVLSEQRLIAGELLPSRREAAAERLRVGNHVVEKDVAGAPAFRLIGPFRHQRPPAPARRWRWNTPASQRPRRRASGRKRPRRRSRCSATRHMRRARQSRNPRGRGWLWRLC